MEIDEMRKIAKAIRNLQKVMIAIEPILNECCSLCGQIDMGQTGEHPCSECGLPWIWDDDENL